MINSFHTCSQSNYLLGKKIASRIKKVDDYFGYLAWSQIFIQENNIDRGVNILRELIADQNTRPEAYYKLWRYYYEKDQYRQAEEIAAQAFVKVTHLNFSHYFIIFCICYAKSFVRTGKIRGALELLQQKYLEHPKHAIFLYQYGRFCIKNAEEAYLICGITALEECLSVCDISLHGKINFWLGKGYLNYDFPVKSNKFLNESLKLLQHSQIKKNSEIHTLLGRLNTLITKLKQIETSKNIAKADEMSVKIAETHPIDGVIAFARSLWNIDKEGALSILLGHKNNISRCDFHFLIFSYAKKIKDFKTLKSLTKKLVDKCKDMMMTTSEWMLCHIWFAKALAHTGKPDKAIFLLKCLGKVFPDLPYMDLKYTKALSSASTVLDLVQAKYVDQDFRNSVHIVSNAYLTALAARDVPLFLQEKKDQAQIIYAADSIIDSMILDASLLNSGFEEEKVPIRPTIHRYKEKRNKIAEVNEIASQKFEVLLQKRNRATFLGFSLSSNPEFLYQIGKIALVNNIELDDGLCAIEDFLEIIENPIKRLKGVYIKAMLFYKKNQPSEYMPLMQDICFLLKKNNLNKEYNIVKEILDARQ